MIPDGLKVRINLGSWPVLPIFGLLKELGGMSVNSIYNTFNMGIGMVMAVDSGIEQEVVRYLGTLGEKAYVIGEVIKGEAGVELC
jgi:phosphoribosylformylglycinamidine cyclo-ligase